LRLFRNPAAFEGNPRTAAASLRDKKAKYVVKHPLSVFAGERIKRTAVSEASPLAVSAAPFRNRA
jgi:hypothetical protein